MGLAIVFRLPVIGRDSLWYDEAVSFQTAEWPFAIIFSNAAQDPHPPFYYALLHSWFAIFPNTDVSGRLLSLILNLLLIPLVYFLVIQLSLSRKTAVITTILIAISPFHILYSHELRMYTLLMLLTVTTIYAYLRACDETKWPWWGLFAASALLLIYTHLFAWFVLIAIGIHALIHHQNRTQLWRTMLVGLLLLICFLPWITILLGESQAQIGSLRPLALNDRIIELNPIIPLTIVAFLIFGQALSVWYIGIVLFLTIASILIFILEIRKAKAEPNTSRLLLPSLIILCVVTIPVIVYYFRPFFLPERTMASASPFLFILLAWGIERRKSPLPYLVGLTAVIMLIGSTLYLTGDPLKPPYRQATQFISENREVGDAILHTSDGSYLSALSYATFPNHAILADDPDTRKPTTVYEQMGGEVWTAPEAVQMGDRLWLIIALEHSVEWQIEQSEFFTEQLVEIERHDFNGIIVILFDIN